jgi:L-rhamnose-H+ transport protein
MVVLGVLLHAIGGLAAGSFYIPFKKVRNWAWESYWLVGGLFSWLIMPWLIASLTVPHLLSLLGDAPTRSVFWTYVFGVLWGVGGLTFGLSMRYLGMSLGYAIALGFCAAFGFILPPVFTGAFGAFVSRVSGWTILAGVAVCLAGIALCGWAGMSKEKELSSDQKRATIKEFSFLKGLLVAVFAGVMSSCMAFGIAAGKPIAHLAVERGAAPLWQNSPVFIIVMAGGFTTNFIWCVILNVRNRSARDYVAANDASLAGNYLFSALAGITWYLQFMFYGMGTTKMGRYDFSSWTIHMAFIIAFSNLWALLFREWKGSSGRTLRMVVAGILVVVSSTIVIGAGNYLASIGR